MYFAIGAAATAAADLLSSLQASKKPKAHGPKNPQHSIFEQIGSAAQIGAQAKATSTGQSNFSNDTLNELLNMQSDSAGQPPRTIASSQTLAAQLQKTEAAALALSAKQSVSVKI